MSFHVSISRDVPSPPFYAIYAHAHASPATVHHTVNPVANATLNWVAQSDSNSAVPPCASGALTDWVTQQLGESGNWPTRSTRAAIVYESQAHVSPTMYYSANTVCDAVSHSLSRTTYVPLAGTVEPLDRAITHGEAKNSKTEVMMSKSNWLADALLSEDAHHQLDQLARHPGAEVTSDAMLDILNAGLPVSQRRELAQEVLSQKARERLSALATDPNALRNVFKARGAGKAWTAFFKEVLDDREAAAAQIDDTAHGGEEPEPTFSSSVGQWTKNDGEDSDVDDDDYPVLHTKLGWIDAWAEAVEVESPIAAEVTIKSPATGDLWQSSVIDRERGAAANDSESFKRPRALFSDLLARFQAKLNYAFQEIEQAAYCSGQELDQCSSSQFELTSAGPKTLDDWRSWLSSPSSLADWDEMKVMKRL